MSFFKAVSELPSLLRQVIIQLELNRQGIYVMSAATDHLAKAISDLTAEIDSVVTELEGLSNDTEDEATATALDNLATRLKGAGSAASTAVQTAPQETPSPEAPPQSGNQTASGDPEGTHRDGSGNLLNADGTPYVAQPPA